MHVKDFGLLLHNDLNMSANTASNFDVVFLNSVFALTC